MTQRSLAPIVLFVYNRLWHTQQTIKALKNNSYAKESDLYIFSDASKNLDGEKQVIEVREYLKLVTGFKSVTVIRRKTNFGLASSIIDGVTFVLKKHDRVIILEDDLVTSPSFLKFMNEALELYKNETRVASIHAYVYPINDLPETFFIRGADCWGWATWRNSWNCFESDAQKLLSELKSKKLSRLADFNKTYNYTKMLKDQISGKVDSWAIRWYMVNFLLDKLTLYPGKSLIQNIGNDSSGTHSENSKRYNTNIQNEICLQKIDIVENEYARNKFEEFFKSLKLNVFQKLIKKTKFGL